jgi:hypothetical protein
MPCAVNILLERLLKAYPLFRGCAGCPDAFASLRERAAGLPEPDFPVDIVYAWVNGAEPQWRAKRDAYLPPEAEREELREGESLFRDNDELRYSLRSMAAHAPWARRIHIVTDGQIPAWLNRQHEKIRVTDHKDCIPPEHLPTFNSHVVEAYLHTVEELAEHYIYCNDDFFLAAPCRKGDFFTPNGLPLVFPDWRESRCAGYTRADTPHAVSYRTTRALLEQAGIRPAPGVIAAHMPYPQTKSNAAAAFAFFAERVKAFGKFRAAGDIAMYCHGIPLWAYAHKKTVPCDAPFYYINVKRSDRKACYAALLREKNRGTLPLLFCLNDVGDADPGHLWREDMANFLAAFYPEPSVFENCGRLCFNPQPAPSAD